MSANYQDLTSAEIIEDSISVQGARLTTMVVVFPRPYLAELNTHREQSKNSASSRAIPPEKLLQMVTETPYVPTFNRRVTGMGVGGLLSADEQASCEREWLLSRDSAVHAACRLLDTNVDKSRINRLLEPFMWHTALLSATTWRNFFGLRKPVGDEIDYDFPAQPEMQTLAIAMHKEFMGSEPMQVESDQWHLPFLAAHERQLRHAPELSAGRCARISYLKHADGEGQDRTLARAAGMAKGGHWSPFEHQAYPAQADHRSGNFVGWVQNRKCHNGESNSAFTRPDLVGVN